MSPLLRTLSAATAGAVVATAVCLGQPALADRDRSATAERGRPQITTHQIKNHTIKTKDLRGSILTLLGLAGSALQSVPANAITRDKMADNSVGSPEVINNSLVASDLAQGSVGANEIAVGAVGSNQVKDGSLTSADVTSLRGIAAITFSPATIPNNGCATGNLPTAPAKVLDNDLILITQPVGVDPNLVISARSAGAGLTSIQFNACNNTGASITPGAVTVPYAVIDN